MRNRTLLRELHRAVERTEVRMAERTEDLRERNKRDEEATREMLRELHERNLREHRITQAAVENNNRITRELLLQGEEDRRALREITQGLHAQTQGLLHVLDELRNGRGGPGTAPAA